MTLNIIITWAEILVDKRKRIRPEPKLQLFSVITLSTKRNYTKHNDTKHNDTKHNDTEHKDTKHKDTQLGTQHKDTQHNDT